MSQISYSGTVLSINGKSIVVSHEISEAFEALGVIVVFLDPDADLGKGGQYQNLIAYDFNGVELWKAELPTSKSSDVYWKIASKSPLTVYSYSSYECVIDTSTGKIVKKDFYK